MQTDIMRVCMLKLYEQESAYIYFTYTTQACEADVMCVVCNVIHGGYFVAYKPIKLLSISFMFIEMKIIYFHSYVMFAMKSMSIYND